MTNPSVFRLPSVAHYLVIDRVDIAFITIEGKVYYPGAGIFIGRTKDNELLLWVAGEDQEPIPLPENTTIGIHYYGEVTRDIGTVEDHEAPGITGRLMTPEELERIFGNSPEEPNNES